MNRVWCELALVEGRPVAGVVVDIVDGRHHSVEVGVESAPAGATRLTGLTVPGLANAHSHAFQRALRSRTQADRGSFWTWRDLMYHAASSIDPDGYLRLARATFAEMVLAGISCVGEFHYLHHQPDGTPYADPNAMGDALLEAAADAGLRITLLDTLYLHGSLGAAGFDPPAGAQRRFSDGSVDAWVDRVRRLRPTDHQRIGAAVHSVRAVDPASIAALAAWAGPGAAPVHAHVSEQPDENEACRAHHGTTPVGVLADAGVLGPSFSAVHATHVDPADIGHLAETGSTVVMCPTTERDLGDGIAPTSEFAASGIPVALGSDSHAVIDLFEEARALELHERLRSGHRGVHAAGDLLAMATVNGHRSLGWDDAGAIEVGNRADLVTVSLDSVRTAGGAPAHAVETSVFAATTADVTDVHVDGRHVVADGRHRSIDVEAELRASIEGLMARD